MRGLQAIVAVALLALPLGAPKPSRSPFAQDRTGDTAILNRHTIACERAALIASLWPEARPCLVEAVYGERSAAAELEAKRPLAGDARKLQGQLSARFSLVAAAPEPRRLPLAA